jgi:GNAT superfamily N-acetyltransferase
VEGQTTIRMATWSDLASCLHVLAQLWLLSEEPGASDARPDPTTTEETLARLLGSPDVAILVTEEGDRIVGFVDLTFRETIFHHGRTMIIEDIVVDEVHRGRGIGAKMVRFIEAMARQRGCRAIELSSDLHRKDTHRFWTAMGYDCLAYQFRKALASMDDEMERG